MIPKIGAFLMSKVESLTCFSVNPKSATPLRVQLENRLEDFISSASPGTFLPPERTLAASLGISRVTVRNAISKFCERGDIIRQGRKGTTVASKKGNPTSLFEDNALAHTLPWMASAPVELRFRLYENLSAQRIFWDEAAAAFNRKNPAIRVINLWPDQPKDGSPDDLILIPATMKTEDSACEPPAWLQKLVNGEEFLHKFVSPDKRRITLHWTVPYLFCNERKARAAGIADWKEYFLAGKWAECISKAYPKLREDDSCMSRVWNFITFRGVRADGKIPESMLETLQSLASFAGKKRVFATVQRQMMDSLQNFLDGRQLFWEGPPSTLQEFHEADFSLGYIPIQPAKDCLRPMSSVDACIALETRHPEEAAQYLAFLLSEPIQQLAGKWKNHIPIHRKGFLNYAQKYFDFDEKAAWELYAGTIRADIRDSQLYKYMYFMIYETRPELIGILDGELSPDEAFLQMKNKCNTTRS
jgi:DNA-binding transcriptional regulator YhcF (GntR family)